MLDEALLKAYNETEYRLLLEPVIVLVPGQTSSAADDLLNSLGDSSAIVMTAYNPMSVTKTEPENDQAQSQLIEDINSRGLKHFPAEGVGMDGLWPPEPSIFICGLNATEANNLAVKYKQAAFVEVNKGMPITVVVTDFEPKPIDSQQEQLKEYSKQILRVLGPERMSLPTKRQKAFLNRAYSSLLEEEGSLEEISDEEILGEFERVMLHSSPIALEQTLEPAEEPDENELFDGCKD